MSIKNKIITGTVSVGTGQVLSNALSFIRNIIIARLLSPGDYGVAALFALTIQFFEMLSNLSAQTLLVQADYGDEKDFGGMVHYVQLLRGIAAAAIIFLTGGFLANLFSVPEAKWAFRILALVPVMRGLVHQDMNRLHREYRFLPMVITENTAGLVSTLGAIPICLAVRNYYAALWILVLHSVVMSAVSHLVAERKYHIKPYWKYAGRIFNFGWPLLLNGFLMFIIFQGDRFIIGSSKKIFLNSGYSLEVLGFYSVAFAVTLTPSIMISRIFHSLFLPFLSQVKSDTVTFLRRYRLVFIAMSLILGVFTLLFILGGGHIINLVYGKKYAEAASVIGILGIMQGVRLLKVVPIIAAISVGDTKNPLVSNAFRVTGFIGAVACAFYGLSYIWIAVFGVVGEVIGAAASIIRIKVIHNIPIASSLVPASIVFCFLAISVVFGRFYDYPAPLFKFVAFYVVTCLLMCGSFAFYFKKFRFEFEYFKKPSK